MPVHRCARDKRRESEAMETKYDIGSGSQEELNRSKVIASAVHSKVRGCSSRIKELHEDYVQKEHMCKLVQTIQRSENSAARQCKLCKYNSTMQTV